MTTNNVQLPNGRETFYYCKVEKMALEPDVQYHIVKFEPIINNHKYVHHMTVYECNDKLQSNDTSRGYECYTPEMPVDIAQTCFRIIVGWSFGGGTFVFPKDVGLPIGGRKETYLVIEVK